MTDTPDTKAPGNRWEHPTHLEKVRRNEEANAHGEYNGNNADDHPSPTPLPNKSPRLDPRSPDGRR